MTDSGHWVIGRFLEVARRVEQPLGQLPARWVVFRKLFNHLFSIQLVLPGAAVCPAGKFLIRSHNPCTEWRRATPVVASRQ